MNAPILVERMSLIADSAGGGRFRGGMALRKDVRLLAEAGRVTNLGDRHKSAPYGLGGGGPGHSARLILNPGRADEAELESTGTYLLKKDDVLSMRTAGAGGFGDPATRDPAVVSRDIRAGIDRTGPSPLLGLVGKQALRAILPRLRRRIANRMKQSTYFRMSPYTKRLEL